MVNIRSSLKLHRRSKTQGDSEGGQGDTLPRVPVPITTNIEEEEEEEEEENEAIRADVIESEAKKWDLSHERGGVIEAKKVAQEVTEVGQGDTNSFHVGEEDEVEDVEEYDEAVKIDIDGKVKENGFEDTKSHMNGEMVSAFLCLLFNGSQAIASADYA